MTWIRRYRLRRYLRSSLWVIPLAAALAAVCCHRLVWQIDIWTRWRWLDFTPEGAQAIVSAITSSGLTFIIFILTMIFIAVQIAASQMTPRITAIVIDASVSKLSLSFFVFTYIFSTAAGGRLVEPIPQLVVLLTVVFSLVSIALFLLLVGFTARAVRPVSVFAHIAEETARVIDALYPAMVTESDLHANTDSPIRDIQPMSIPHCAKSGIFTAFDAQGLARIAERNGCLIQLVPQVGDFVAQGDPLFSVYKGDGVIQEHELRQLVAFGSSHTFEQNPAFGFRIIVDIAIRALSPAINDPTTAVRALDRIQTLLSRMGARHLGGGRVLDSQGRPRLIFPSPDWEDYLWLGLSEIRSYGAGSLQVVRRMRGLLEYLGAILPPKRVPAVLKHLRQLERVVGRNFTDPEDLEKAGIGDFQGLGGAQPCCSRVLGAKQ